jgi:UDP-2,3-diacylglucosamine pyrophosphatase LpxH
MPTPPLSDDKCQEAVDAMALHGTVTAAALALNMNRATLEGRLREARRRGFVSSHPPRLILKGQSIFHGPDGSEQGRWDKTKQEGREPADSVQLPDPKKIVKVSTLYDQQGKVTQQWIAEKPEEAAREALWTAFAQKLADEIKPAKPIAKPKGFSHMDLLAVYPVGDHHVGQLAWDQETGGENYDLKVAEDVLRDASLRLIDTCPPCEQALIAFLGDFFHYDSYDSVTPAHKNLLDADGRYPKMVDVGVRMIRHMITAALERHQKVRVIFEKGNHDPATAAAVTVFLSHLYENEPRVSIDKSPRFFHYYEFGAVLLGTHHGDKVKKDKLLAVMATDMAEAWGRTTYRFVMVGHGHHEDRTEYPGGFVEMFGVLAASDAYAANHGYRSRRQMQALVFHREHGLVARHVVNPGMFDAKVAA